ncbi:MAG: hypothetical protein H6875_07170 [Hyphomicrobiaceae bacterium]|nr:hypothetical protein [Hyphomicrobiaceae bacterium]
MASASASDCFGLPGGLLRVVLRLAWCFLSDAASAVTEGAGVLVLLDVRVFLPGPDLDLAGGDLRADFVAGDVVSGRAAFFAPLRLVVLDVLTWRTISGRPS